MEAEFGAPAMYINGPCANLAMKKGFEGFVTYDSSAAEAKRLGDALAAFLIDQHKTKEHIPLGDADNCKVARFGIKLPMKEDLPHTREYDVWAKRQQDEEAAESAMREAIDSGKPAYAVKSLIDDRYRATYRSLYIDRTCRFTEEELASHQANVDFNVLQLGDYLFMGIPGESLVEMTHWMRSTFTGSKTITLDQVNGYYSYLATPTSMTLGGYTYWYSWVDRTAIPTLKESIVAAMDEFKKR